MSVVLLFASLGLLGIGLSLSAFFSGAETAFYRVSLLRVAAAAQAGDRPSRRILRFIRRPAEFVATVLVGNNVANYLVTVAIGGLLAAVIPIRSDAVEIAGTVLFAPVVFLLGELVPKNVNFLQPLRSLSQKVRLFSVFHYLLRPLSWPLVQLTRLFGPDDDDLAAGLVRSQLSDVIERGGSEGVLTETQVRLGNALLRTGSQPIAGEVTPIERVEIIDADTSLGDALAIAHRRGLASLILRTAGESGRWVGSVSVGQLLRSSRDETAVRPRDLACPLPSLRPETPRLLASQLIRESGSGFALVVSGNEVVGLVDLQSVSRPLLADGRHREQ